MTKRTKKTTRLASRSARAVRPLTVEELGLAVGGVKSTSALGAGLPHGHTGEVSSGSDAGLPHGWNASPNSRHKQLLTEMI